MIGELTLAVLFVLAVFFVGFTPATLMFALYYVLQEVGAGIPLLFFVVAVSVLYAAFVWFRRSAWAALIDLMGFGLVVVGWAIAKFATAVRRLGFLFSFMSWLKGGLSRYPGEEFIKNRREDVVQQAIKHHERGNVEIEDTPEILAAKTRQAYDDAGRRLSNGEAVLGLSLAAIAFLPLDSMSIPFSAQLSSPITGGFLSIALVFVVALRLSALDMVLVREVSDSENIARLAVYKDWNETMADGTEVVKVFLMFRAMRSISESAYDFYLDWVFERTINGTGVGTLELVHELRKPMFAFQRAEREGITPSEASHEIYGWDVFSEFKFGLGRDSPAPNEPPHSRLDEVVGTAVEIKGAIKDIWRIIYAYQFAQQNDMEPEEASKQLYGENLIPNQQGQAENENESA